MTTTASIDELRNAGGTFEAEEAVAIARQLIRSLCDDDARGVEPPYGPPTAANVFLNEDGSVTCRGCGTAPAVFDVAIFLDTLLPASPRVPGGLRYAIARAMLAVDVAPFDSLEEFSQALAKYEVGPRDDVVRRLLKRWSSSPVARPPAQDRRKPRVTASELRRSLREADARAYQQQTATSTRAGSAQVPPDRTMPVVATCVAVGVFLVASGELMHNQRALPLPVPPQPPAAVDLSRSALPAAPLARQAEPVSDRAAMPSPAADVPAKRPSMKPASARARPAAVRPSARPPVRRGVLDRMRLGWLRKAFRSDL